MASIGAGHGERSNERYPDYRFDGLMAEYAASVAAGRFKKTDTVFKVLGRPPRSYTDWLAQNLPVGS